jgi:GNAT superfamily N-acetyltransferase
MPSVPVTPARPGNPRSDAIGHGPADLPGLVTIRPVGDLRDWEAIRELCCRTGEAGDPIAPRRWCFFAELWVGPYERLAPGWAYVADADGRIVGYLTGCPDTRAFRRRRRLAVTLPLLGQVVVGRYAWTRDTRRFVRRALGLARDPEDAVRARGPRRLWADYPAHLHMNVEAGVRNQGIGRALLGRFARDLRTRGVPGLHLYCGTAPRRFYLQNGFEELQALEFRPGTWVHLLGRRLAEGGPTR